MERPVSTTPVLHYIYDPLCGWCYGAKPLIEAARGILPVVAHGGGMMTGAHRRPVTAQLRDYVMPHDQRIAELTGQPFGEAYFEGLLRDTTAVFDSEPPTGAILAAEQVAGRGLELLGRLQTAHYVEGRRIADENVLLALAADIGLDAEAFKAAFIAALDGLTQAHFKDSRALLARVGGQGFPTAVLEQSGRYQVIDLGGYLGKPQAFADWLRQLDGVAVRHPNSPAPACGLNGCGE
ncbi:protein-disulfide isomerase [Pseudomonas versuta]|uniref:Protein-disulfide isomerase n=1 Tax=Pseudomonas versuta TaxID=1788301 RepID=A0A853ZXB5_9PSED|nr:DsbA family protein [Pseudomonas versuta]OKA18767.1 protein-disulfide isomerase [Pseudomonas versuta]